MAVDTTYLRNSNADINEQLMTAQQRLAMAQTLRSQSLQPLQAPSGQNAIISPFSALAQALNGYTANQGTGAAIHELAGAQAAQSQNQMGMMQAIGRQLKAQMSGAPDAPPQPTDAAPSPQAPPAGASPQALGNALQNGAQPTAPQSQAPTGGASDPIGAGLTAELFGLDKFAGAAYDRAALTPEQKNSRDALIGQLTQNNLATQNMPELQRLQRARALLPPDSPQIAEIDGQIKKLNYIAPVSVAPSTLMMKPDGSGPLAYNPPAIKGAVPKFTTVNGFTTAPSVAPQGGAAAVNAAVEGAAQGAKEANTIKTVTNPDGGQRTDYGARVVGTTGPGTTDAAIQKSTADVLAQAPQISQQSSQARSGLENALGYLDKVGQSGPGSAKKFDMLGLLNTAGIPIDKGDVNGYQSMQKYLANSLNTAAQGTGAGGSDARFESFMHGQPNGETMSPDALRGAIKYVLSQHDAALARSQFLPAAYNQAKASGDPNAALTAQQKWSQAYNPKVFEFSRMSQPERAQFKAGMAPDQQNAFGQQYNFAHQQGWVQ